MRIIRDSDGDIHPVRAFALLICLIIGALLVVSSVYTIQEGHVGIVKRFGEAVSQVSPGLHIKVPFVDEVVGIEVRQRKNVEELSAATRDQLAIAVTTSINWTVIKENAKELFIRYGGLDNFEGRILDPKLRSTAKAALSQFSAEQLIRNRQEAVALILEGMTRELAEFPVTINSPQIEDIRFPRTYTAAIEAKERTFQEAEREKHALAQQKLKAQQAVNSAEANAAAKKLEADAESYRIKEIAEAQGRAIAYRLEVEADARAHKIEVEAIAEAKAIEVVTQQLQKSPRYIDLVKAKSWDGKVPRTMLGDQSGVLFSLGNK